jgi:hypothetical protein
MTILRSLLSLVLTSTFGVLVGGAICVAALSLFARRVLP